MRSQQLFIVPLIASWLLLALLSPAEAGLVSWISNVWKRPSGNGKAGNTTNNAASPVTNGPVPVAESPPNNSASPVANGNGAVSNAESPPNIAASPVVNGNGAVYNAESPPNIAASPVANGNGAVYNAENTPINAASPVANGNGAVSNATPDSLHSLFTAFSPMVTSQHVTFGDGVFFGGGGSIGMWGTQTNFGSVYQVTIQKQKQNGECVESVKIGLQGSKLEKTLKNKCSESVIRRVRNDEDLLLIGSPDENFCVFTTNENEVYYLQDGKWKKGDFSDNTKDNELTLSEITAVKERIKKWQAFFEKSDKEIQRIRGLKVAERSRFQGERARIWNEREKERQTHFAINNEIYRLKAEERKKHASERNNIYSERAKEGWQWSAAIEQLQSAEEERHENRMSELDEMKEKEDKRFETALNDFEDKVFAEESKSEEELSRLESLEAAEEIRALQEMKENIKQGW